MIRKIISLLLLLSATGCASPEGDLNSSNYVSSAQYEGYNCHQLQAELDRISTKIQQASGQNVLSAAVTVFAISQGYGYDDSGSDGSKRLQNQYDVVDSMLIKKDCIR